MTITGTFPDIHRIDVEWTVDIGDGKVDYYEVRYNDYITCEVLVSEQLYTTKGAEDCESQLTKYPMTPCTAYHIIVFPRYSNTYTAGVAGNTDSWTLPGKELII